MKDVKNVFGKNLEWFLSEVAVSIHEFVEDGCIPTEIEVMGETSSGIECSTDVDLVELLTSALAVIQERQEAIKVLSDALSKLTDGTDARVSGIALEALCVSDDILGISKNEDNQ